MSYSKKYESLKQQMAGLSGDLLVDVEQKIGDLSTLLEDVPEQVSLKFAGDPKSDEAEEHSKKLKELKKNWNKAKRDVDGLIAGGTGKRKKSSGSADARKNVSKEEKQESIKLFVEQSGGTFTRGDVEKHLKAEFEREVALQFYKPMLDHLVEEGVITSQPADKNNPKSAITYRLKKDKTVDFSSMK